MVYQGDELLEVSGNSVSGKTAFEAASLIQGPQGTKVSLKVGFNSYITVYVSVESSFTPSKLASLEQLTMC